MVVKSQHDGNLTKRIFGHASKTYFTQMYNMMMLWHVIKKINFTVRSYRYTKSMFWPFFHHHSSGKATWLASLICLIKHRKTQKKKKLLLHFLGNLGDGRCLSPQYQHLFRSSQSSHKTSHSALIKDAGCCAFSCFLVAACFDTLCPHQHYKETQYGHRGLNAIKWKPVYYCVMQTR